MSGRQDNLDNSNMSEDDEIQRIEDEEIDNKSSGDETTNPKNTRKRHHRHTQQQIETLESFFEQNPHPDAQQRNELSQIVGMEPLQIKFWFQNKRTQMKSKHEHQENKQLRDENAKLRAENKKYRKALSNVGCSSCGRMTVITDHLTIDERHLRMENARLREEIDLISAVAASYIGKPSNNNGGAGSPSSGKKRD